MKCNNCGAVLTDKMAFCTKCGQKVQQCESIESQGALTQCPRYSPSGNAITSNTTPSKKVFVKIGIVVALVAVLCIVFKTLPSKEAKIAIEYLKDSGWSGSDESFIKSEYGIDAVPYYSVAAENRNKHFYIIEVSAQGESKTFGRIYIVKVDGEDADILSWGTYEEDGYGRESRSEVLEQLKMYLKGDKEIALSAVKKMVYENYESDNFYGDKVKFEYTSVAENSRKGLYIIDVSVNGRNGDEVISGGWIVVIEVEEGAASFIEEYSYGDIGWDGYNRSEALNYAKSSIE